MKFTLVPKEEVMTVWPTVAPLLEKALSHNPGKYDTVDVYADLVTGAQSLWLAFDETVPPPERLTKGIRAFWTVRINSYPLCRMLNIEWVGGEDSVLWVDGGLAILVQYAKENGCDGMTGLGRDGWGRKFQPEGWKPIARLYEKMFKEEG
jgi:hypothetical protein